MLITPFESFCQRPGIQRLREILTRRVARPIWWQIGGEIPKTLNYTKARAICPFVRASGAKQKICQKKFVESLERSRRTQQLVQWICPIDRYAVSLPVVSEAQVQGYLAVCHSQEEIPAADRAWAPLVVESVVREKQRDEELKNVSESIQPRCVALSTVHTIHRLISSTLNLEELLPRVARLCCQVLRAQFCTIWLVDRNRHWVVPRAAVSTMSRKPHASVSSRLGKGLAGQVAASCRARMTKLMMMVPLVEEECLGVVAVRRSSSLQPFGALDQEILTTLAEQAVVAIRNAQMYETQERVTWGTIKSLSAILEGMESHAPSSKTHYKFLARVSVAIGQKMRLSLPQQKVLEYAAYLHDAGRLGIPQEIFRKPTKLEPAEFAMVKEHTVKGARLLEPLEILEPAIPIILHHHERYDGTGYPKGLQGDAIPLGARIVAVANAFEAMVFERPYRKKMTIEEAAREMASHSGTQFDPKVVEAFLGLVRSKEFESLLLESST